MAPAFSQKMLDIKKMRWGCEMIEIFNNAVYFAPVDVRIWMFLPIIPNRSDLKAAVRVLHDRDLVLYSEEMESFLVSDRARVKQRDDLNRIGEEEMILKRSISFLKTVKPSYYSHYVSVYLHFKQYPNLCQDLNDLPGNMLRGIIDAKKELIAFEYGKEWNEFLTKNLGESHWTVLHLRSRLGLAMLGLGKGDEAVNMLVDVYQKTCNAFGEAEIDDVLQIMTEVVIWSDPTNKQLSENLLRRTVFNGGSVSECKTNSDFDKWIKYAELIGSFGLVTVGNEILKDIGKFSTLLDQKDTVFGLFQSKVKLLTFESRYPKALRILQDVLPLIKKKFGTTDTETLKVMMQKGNILFLQGKLKEAQAVFEQLVTRSASALGESDPLFLTAKTELVRIHMLGRNFDEALEHCSGVQEQLAAAYGVIHPQCFSFRKHLGIILWEKNKRFESLRVFKDLLEDFENSYEHESDMKYVRSRTESIESSLFSSEICSLQSYIRSGCTREAIQLISKYNVNLEDPSGQTSLHYAAAFEAVEVARALLENGAVYLFAKSGFAPIDLARAGGQVHALLTTVHAFFEAVKDGDIDSVTEVAVNEPCVLGARNAYGANPLLIAARNGFMEVFKVLLALGSDPNVRGCGDFQDETPLVVAAKQGHVKVVNTLLDILGPKVLERDNVLETTLLHVAARGGHLPMVRFLLARGAVYDARDHAGWTPRECAAYKKPVKDMLGLIEGLFLDAKMGMMEKVTARMRKVKKQEVEAVAGTRNDEGRTLVQVAMKVGKVELVKKLVKGLKSD